MDFALFSLYVELVIEEVGQDFLSVPSTFREGEQINMLSIYAFTNVPGPLRNP